MNVDRGSVPSAVDELARSPQPLYALQAGLFVLYERPRLGFGVGPSLGASYRISDALVTGLMLAGPVMGVTFKTAQGSANIRQEIGCAYLGWVFYRLPSVSIGVELIGGALFLQALGQPRAPLIGLTDDVWGLVWGGGIPTDARIAFAVAPSGDAYVAWSDNALENVHVTPLTALLTRLGPDIIVAGHDVGGLVALNDGFALLLSRDDPGDALVNLNVSSDNDALLGYASVLVRYTGNAETFAAPLTGTASITTESSGPMLDCIEILDGRLAFDGSRYGAYFTVHQCLSLNALDQLDPHNLPSVGGYAVATT